MGNGVADASGAMLASPGDPISLDEYGNSPREAAPLGEGGIGPILRSKIVSQMSETRSMIRGDLCHPCSKL